LSEKGQGERQRGYPGEKKYSKGMPPGLLIRCKSDNVGKRKKGPKNVLKERLGGRTDVLGQPGWVNLGTKHPLSLNLKKNTKCTEKKETGAVRASPKERQE